jgi:3-methyladenine DNA glycosylase/8-oxoguanine DNA glycosylase
MTKLTKHFEYVMAPNPPYNFKLTVKKPAGWSLFSPFEIYEGETLWTATDLCGELVGIRLHSSGTLDKPRISVRVFSSKSFDVKLQSEAKRTLYRMLGADQELYEFYRFAKKDGILKHVIENLYGMHDTFTSAIFPDAALAILLQMAPLKRSNEMMASFIKTYGETAEFDGKKIKAWPTPERISRITPVELARKCKVGYRAKSIVKLAKMLSLGGFPSMEMLESMEPEKAKELLLELPGIGDYSADIINPHGGFPIDVWSAEVFGKLFFGREPRNNRDAVDRVKKEGLKRWGKCSWMAFFYVVQDLNDLSKRLEMKIRLT